MKDELLFSIKWQIFNHEQGCDINYNKNGHKLNSNVKKSSECRIIQECKSNIAAFNNFINVLLNN